MDEITLAKEYVEMVYAIFGGNTNTMLALQNSIYKQMTESEEIRENVARFNRIAKQIDVQPGDKDAVRIMDIEPGYSKILFDICRNSDPPIGCCPISVGNADHDAVTIFRKQEREFRNAVKEASVRSGQISEVSLESITKRGGKGKETSSIADMMHRHGNDLKVINDITPDQFNMLKRDVNALGIKMTFAVSRPYEKNGNTYVRVGFPSKTEARYDVAGHVYRKPPVYDMSAVVGALLLKKNLLDKSDTIDSTFERMHTQEQFRHQRIEALMNNESTTFDSIAEKVKASSAESKDQITLLKTIDRLRDRDISKAEFSREVEAMERIPESMKREIIADADSLGKSKHVIEVTMERGKDGNTVYVPNTDESLQVGRAVTWKRKDRKDKVLTDTKAIKGILEGNLKSIQEKGYDGKEHTFIELTEDEYNRIMQKSPDIVNEKGELKVEAVKFLKENDKAMKEMSLKKPVSKMDEYEKMAAHVVKTIDERREEFMLKTDNDIVDGISVIETGIRSLVENPEMTSGTAANREQSNVEVEKDETMIEDNLSELEQAIYETYEEIDEFDSGTSFEELVEEGEREAEKSREEEKDTREVAEIGGDR